MKHIDVHCHNTPPCWRYT